MLIGDKMGIIESFATIASSIATFGVALFTLYNVINLRKQVHLLEKQTLLQRSTVYPFLEIQRMQIEKNKMFLTLENVGKGIAVQIGLRVSVIPAKLAENVWDFITVLRDLRNGEIRKIYPSRSVVFLKDESNHFRLHPGDKKQFSGAVYFYFKDQKKNWASGKFYSFDELINLLNKNKIRFAAVTISLVYKDISESIIETENISSFVIDIMRHKSLEDAMQKEKIPFTQRALSLEEIPCIEGELYEELKSRRGFLEEPFK